MEIYIWKSYIQLVGFILQGIFEDNLTKEPRFPIFLGFCKILELQLQHQSFQ